MHAKWIPVAMVALAATALCSTASFAAGAWPTKTIRILAAGPTGGPIDVMSRLVGQKLSEQLGQSVVIDNRAGAGGTLATRIAVSATPDGHTLLCNSSQYAAAYSLYKDYAWIAYFAPAGTPKAIVDKLNRSISAIVTAPDSRERLSALGFDPVNNSADQFTAYIKVEVSKWAKVIKESGARID